MSTESLDLNDVVISRSVISLMIADEVGAVIAVKVGAMIAVKVGAIYTSELSVVSDFLPGLDVVDTRSLKLGVVVVCGLWLAACDDWV